MRGEICFEADTAPPESTTQKERRVHIKPPQSSASLGQSREQQQTDKQTGKQTIKQTQASVIYLPQKLTESQTLKLKSWKENSLIQKPKHEENRISMEQILYLGLNNN